MNEPSRLSPERRVRVVRGNGDYLVAPLGPLPEFPEFVLPPLPSLFVHTLISTANVFFEAHERCVAFCFLIHPDLQRWQAVPPTQTCGPDAAHWSYIPDDYLDWDRWLLGGSFQIAQTSGIPSIMKRVPAHDGIHVVVSLSDGIAMFCLRMQDQPMVIDPGVLLIDDLKDLTDRYRDRFTL